MGVQVPGQAVLVIQAAAQCQALAVVLQTQGLQGQALEAGVAEQGHGQRPPVGGEGGLPLQADAVQGALGGELAFAQARRHRGLHRQGLRRPVVAQVQVHLTVPVAQLTLGDQLRRRREYMLYLEVLRCALEPQPAGGLRHRVRRRRAPPVQLAAQVIGRA